MLLRHVLIYGLIYGAIGLTLAGCGRKDNPEEPFPKPLGSGDVGLVAQSTPPIDLGILEDQKAYQPPQGQARASGDTVDSARDVMSRVVDAALELDILTLLELTDSQSLGVLSDDEAKEALIDTGRKLQNLWGAIETRLEEPELSDAKLAMDTISDTLTPERLKDIFRYEVMNETSIKVDIDQPRAEALLDDLANSLQEAFPDSPIGEQIEQARGAAMAGLPTGAGFTGGDLSDDLDQDPNSDAADAFADPNEAAFAADTSGDEAFINEIDGQWLLTSAGAQSEFSPEEKATFLQGMQVAQKGLDILIEFVESTPASTFTSEEALTQAVMFQLFPQMMALQAELSAEPEFGASGDPFGSTEDPFGEDSPADSESDPFEEDDPFAEDDEETADEDPFADDGDADDDPFADDDGDAESDDPFAE